MASEMSRNFFRVDASLLAKFAPYFFMPRPMYGIALKKRHATLCDYFVQTYLRISRGRLWRCLRVSPLHVGFKAGSFAKPRLLAVFRQKASRKKKPTAAAAAANLVSEAKISRIRQKKAGFKKRSVGEFSPAFDAQLAGVG